jgi:hypothetical protein
MTPDIRRTLVIDAAIVAVVVALAFVLAPGVAMVGIVALVVLILGGISFAFSELRARRRRRRVGARRLAAASGRSPYGSSRDAGLPGPGRVAASPPEGPAVRRVPASRRTQAQRKPLR